MVKIIVKYETSLLPRGCFDWDDYSPCRILQQNTTTFDRISSVAEFRALPNLSVNAIAFFTPRDQCLHYGWYYYEILFFHLI